ncbi:MAG: methyltransferase domain-containing protein [Gemmatimonadales bacterium]|nr:MAG: methyltransferase domain-containing protein [Gemmatimonadales bacterium]
MRIIAGEWGGRPIRTPKGKGTRPTADRVREAWMSAMGPSIPGARVLDLFAGSGALGLECLSRGAREVVFVERARSALRALRANIEELGAQDRCRVVVGDALTLAGSLDPGAFELAVADPPYDSGDAGRLVELFRRRPFAGQLWVEHGNRDPIAKSGGGRTRTYGDTALTTLDAPDWEGPTPVPVDPEEAPLDSTGPGQDPPRPGAELDSPHADLPHDESP